MVGLKLAGFLDNKKDSPTEIIEMGSYGMNNLSTNESKRKAGDSVSLQLATVSTATDIELTAIKEDLEKLDSVLVENKESMNENFNPYFKTEKKSKNILVTKNCVLELKNAEGKMCRFKVCAKSKKFLNPWVTFSFLKHKYVSAIEDRDSDYG